MIVPCSNGPFIFSKNEESTCIFFVFFYLSVKKNYLKLETKYDVYVAKANILDACLIVFALNNKNASATQTCTIKG